MSWKWPRYHQEQWFHLFHDFNFHMNVPFRREIYYFRHSNYLEVLLIVTTWSVIYQEQFTCFRKLHPEIKMKIRQYPP